MNQARHPLARSPAAARALERLARAGRPVLFLDLDGTLAPLVERPERAGIPAATLRLLGGLRESGVRLVLVSGRAAGDAARIMGPVPHAIIGNHGAELWERGRSSRWLDPDAARLRHAIQRLAPLLEERADLVLEAKGASLALHTSPRAPGTARRLLPLVRRRLRGLPLQIQAGRGIVDIHSPAVNKGRSVLRWLRLREPPGLRRSEVVYAGDDTSDRAAFAALGREAVTIAVGRHTDGARFRTAGPATLFLWLARLAEARE